MKHIISEYKKRFKNDDDIIALLIEYNTNLSNKASFNTLLKQSKYNPISFH